MPLKHSFELSNRYDAPLYKCDKGVQASRAIDQDLRIFRSSIFPAFLHFARFQGKFKSSIKIQLVNEMAMIKAKLCGVPVMSIIVGVLFGLVGMNIW